MDADRQFRGRAVASRMPRTRQIFALVFVLASCSALACGNDADEPEETGDVCPESIDGAGTWTHEGDDPQCDELAEALSAQGDDDQEDEDDACAQMLGAFVLEEVGGRCEAKLVASCDSGELSIACDVSASGKADCKASVTSPALEAGTCKLELRIR